MKLLSTRIFSSLSALTLLTSQGVRAADADAESGLAEIVVTAEKYDSTILNTPISVSALSGEQLAAAGISTVEQLAHEIPGLSLRSAGPGQTEYEARGLASNAGTSPTVGFYLNEIPLAPPAQSQIGKVVIDPDLYDVNRIELLRGPQGTLYGSSSMGGTVKVITNEPKLGTTEASLQGTVSGTQGGGANGGGNAMFNLPLGELFAVRVVLSDSHRSGWEDRVVLNPFPSDSLTTGLRGNLLAAPVQSVQRNVNTENLYGGRVSVLFQPNSNLSIDAFYLYQHMAMNGYDEFDNPPGADFHAHYEAFNVPEPIRDTVNIYGLTIKDDLGFADLTSATGYWQRHEAQTQDASESVGYFTQSFVDPTFSYVATPYSEIDISRQFSQEIRLSAHPGDRLHWTGGVFYSDESSDWIEYGANPAYAQYTGDPTGIVYSGDNLYRVRQYAVFLDGSYKFNEQWKFETGVRWYKYQSALSTESYGLFAASLTPEPASNYSAGNHGFNPRFDLSYSPTDSLSTYLSASRGFRPGGANQQVEPACDAGKTPPFGPDSVWDYELGEKSRLLDNRLTINADVYYIKWNGVQQNRVLSCGYTYYVNAGDARSFGPEVEIQAKLDDNWTVTANGSYTDAKVNHPTALFAAQIAGTYYTCPTASNCSVPIVNVPKKEGSVALIYTTKVGSDLDLTGRVSAVYVGSELDQAFAYVNLPSYWISNARVSLASGRWSANLFVNNLNNRIAEISANNTQFQFNIPGLVRISTNQPRTFGTEINYRF